MQSQAFIKAAATLIAKIEASQHTFGTQEDLRNQRDGLQKEIGQLFSGLQNPTLPSAYRLRDAALRAGFHVQPLVMQRLAQFEHLG